jgi:acetolactate synthase I/II/III large subunit
MKLKGAEIVWECLVREGVEVVFGYPGGANMPIYDAMLNYPVHHVLVRHEQGGAHMADGYARASGKVGVAMATSGPGATNLGDGHLYGDDGFGSRGIHYGTGRRAFDWR